MNRDDDTAEEAGDQGGGERTRRVTFFVLLAASGLAVAELLSPYFMALVFAAVTVIVTWPLHSWILGRLGGRQKSASVLTALVLVLLVFGPLSTLVYLGVKDATAVIDDLAMDTSPGELADRFEGLIPEREQVPESFRWLLPQDLSPVQALGEGVKDGAVRGLRAVSRNLMSWLEGTLNALLSVVIFLFTVLTLYIEGPAVIAFFKRLIPMEPSYLDQLFKSFHRLSNNLVVGSVATALAQGFVATIGYAIFDVDRIFFLGLLTAVGALIPVLGSPVVWIPVSIMLGFERGWGWGVGMAAYGTLLIGTVDNVIRPLVMRRGMRIHPLLIFLAVFGGIAWFGLPGLLVGPVIMAMFLSLTMIHRADILGEESSDDDEEEAQDQRSRWMRRALRRIWGWLRRDRSS
jgi:predicted PurR-regulated permease PerM